MSVMFYRHPSKNKVNTKTSGTSLINNSIKVDYIVVEDGQAPKGYDTLVNTLNKKDKQKSNKPKNLLDEPNELH